MDRPPKTVAIDADHTLFGDYTWPGIGDWLPGAKEALDALLDDGHKVYVFTARCGDTDWKGATRPLPELWEQTDLVRNKLDDAGYHQIEIVGKPWFDLLIDDRAMRFPPRTNAWKRILPAVRARLER